MTADNIEDKISSLEETATLPIVKICNAKKYVIHLRNEGVQICRDVCTDNCCGYNPDCEYWGREYGDLK